MTSEQLLHYVLQRLEEPAIGAASMRRLIRDDHELWRKEEIARKIFADHGEVTMQFLVSEFKRLTAISSEHSAQSEGNP